ncbi:treslin [Tiliqua scincoides]|uniref:treslin n=1 Tax=Tiliqua scincoides TaxID=71010 RepID=UPI0034631124
MTCSHNVVFLLDMASSVPKASLHLGILRILNYLGCRFGLAKVRWGFKFFDSLGAQGRTSQVGNFHELSSRSWEDFEELLEARFGSQAHSSHLPGPMPRAALTQNILKETLLDYQWDRPEIASPAKPVLRSQKNKLTQPLDKASANSNSSEGFVNAIFLFSPCPHSQRELLQFVSGSCIHLSDELPTSHDLTEKFIPKRIQDMMAGQKVTLYWVDTAEWSKVLESSDYVGYWMLVELLRPLGGTVLPYKTLIQCSQQSGVTLGFPKESRFSELPFTSWTMMLPCDSTLNCLFSLPSALQVSFPQLEGVLILKTEEVEMPRSCAVTLEPLIVGQRHFEVPVNISLKYTMTGWNAVHAGSFHTEQWVLRSSLAGQSVQEKSWFRQLVKHILAKELHMVAEVSLSGSCLPCTGIFSPISDTAAVLSLLSYERATETDKCLLQTAVEGKVSKDEDFSLPEIMNSVLNHVDNSKEDDSANSGKLPSKTPSPEWAQQELHCTHRWSPAVVEGWYLLSDLCGASSHLMESFRLLQAASVTEDETPNPEMELTQCLSEFYRSKACEVSSSSRQQDYKKRHGVPRTPVRKKMKTMPRSLQMLNAARLNVKAQKFQPDGEPPVSEKLPHRLLSRQSDVKAEEKGRKVKTKIGFKTEEELLSYLTAQYQKAVSDEDNLFACVQDIVTAVSAFPKTSNGKLREVACADIIRSCLLKTSKILRQPLGGSPEKESKVKECQLQVYLRLEMSLQCPSLQNSVDEMEQLVEELTEMLRILCLTKDPAYLTKFLEEVVDRYMESIPKILGDLYYSLGTQIPPKLASLLPTDIFSDDSINPGSQTTSLPPSIASVSTARAASLSTEADQLEELRTRSAEKRKNTLARHRSVTEASQNLRQIEIPQGSKCRPKKDNTKACLNVKPLPTAQKVAVQEVTKVRRNLFNGEMLPAGASSLKKISRSRSVSVLEGPKHKRSHSHDGARDSRKLLTKRVAETPLHKQISGRLLHKQMKGRCSDPGSEVCLVEESPEKAVTCGLRRSPRIKHLSLDRTLSGSFQPSQLNLKNMQTSSPRRERPGAAGDSIGSALPNVKRAVQSPKSLLFGAVLEVSTSEGLHSPRTRRKSLASDEPPVYQTPRKTPLRCSPRLLSPSNNTLRRSPRLREKLQQIPQKTPVPKQTAAKNLGKLFSPCRQKSKSLPESRGKGGEQLVPTTPARDRFSSPSKTTQLQTPGKQAGGEAPDDVFVSPPSNPSPAAASFMAAPLLLNSWEKSLLELQPPTLRVAEKAASPAAAQRWPLEEERLSDPELHPSTELDSVLSKVTPAKSRGAPSELPSSPHSAELLDSSPLQVHFALLPAADSPPSRTLSPVRTRKLSRMSRTPQKCPSKPLSIAGISPTKDFRSPSCLSEQHSNSGARLPTKAKLSDKTRTAEHIPSMQRHQQTAEAVSPNERSLERHLSSELSVKDPVRIPGAFVVRERLHSSSVAGAAGCGPLADSPPVNLNPETSQARVLLAEKPAGLQGPLSPSPRRHDLPSSSAAPKSSCCAYVLRCTPDRRQREAAARLGNAEKATVFSSPPSTHILLSATSPPTYAVELEMQASGLPKLRIKRVASGSAPEQHPHVEDGKPQREESDPATGDLSVTWCSRHPGRSEPASISPSCFRSAHSTPGKLGGGQTYICQSYTPTRCPSNATSPSHGNAAVLWTPSPKQKGKVTPEAIKDWPRRKRATGGCNRNERHIDAPELLSMDKALLLGEFELEGVYKLQSPCSDAEPSGDDGGCKSRKRALEQDLLPEEEAVREVKRPCLKQMEPDVAVLLSTGLGGVAPSRTSLEEGDILSISGSTLTPPRSSSKNSISATALWALTQSPLLYQAHSTALRKRPTGGRCNRNKQAFSLGRFNCNSRKTIAT